MRKKGSKAQKRHRKTFHLARHDPERWKQVRENNHSESLRELQELSERLREAEERENIAKGKAETAKMLLKEAQQQASLDIICEDWRRTHEAERLPTCRENWRHWKISARPSKRRSLMSPPTRARPWRRFPRIARGCARKRGDFRGRRSIHQRGRCSDRGSGKRTFRCLKLKDQASRRTNPRLVLQPRLQANYHSPSAHIIHTAFVLVTEEEVTSRPNVSRELVRP
jgi:hypothetical protein